MCVESRWRRKQAGSKDEAAIISDRSIELSLWNRVLVIAAFLLLGGRGYWALFTTPIDAIPDLSENQVIVFTDWTGRSPQKVEGPGHVSGSRWAFSQGSFPSAKLPYPQRSSP